MNSMQTSLLFVSLLSLGACARVGQSRLKDTLPFEVGELEPQLGGGYDSLVQELRNTPPCVVGESGKTTSARSSLDMSQNVDSETLMREFSGEVKGTPRFIFKEAGAALGYYRSLNRSQAGLNLVYAVRVNQGGESIKSVGLKEDLKGLAPTSLLEKCGDHYVAQINRGGMLTITVSFDFMNEESRSKWESQLKLSGSWAEVAKTLKNKVETTGINSTMSVRVVQLGGIPSQALTAGKNCSLTNLEDFNSCKQKVDDLISYASNSFPQQVESNPAVLDYITLPLKGLGVRDLPLIPEEVLQVRKNLEAYQSSATEWNDMLVKGKEVGMSFESSLTEAIQKNRRLIKDAAQACFSYQIKGSDLDWSECLQLGNALPKQIVPIERSRVMIHELSVPAQSEFGNSIINSYSTEMKISYALSKASSWSLDERTEVDIQGLSPLGRSLEASDTPSPSDRRGALLIGQASLSPAELSGNFDLPGGEGLRFLMNESIGKYSDNRGMQTVYWRCTNCNDTQETLPTYRLRVKANEELGTLFASKMDLTGRYKMSAYGLWKSSRFQAASGPQGLDKECGNRCPIPTANTQSLVMVEQASATARSIGTGSILNMQANQPVRFTINDQDGGYGDNSGGVEVVLQCLKSVQSDIRSFPITIDPE